jgi:hypothetical protein
MVWKVRRHIWLHGFHYQVGRLYHWCRNTDPQFTGGRSGLRGRASFCRGCFSITGCTSVGDDLVSLAFHGSSLAETIPGWVTGVAAVAVR